MMFIQVKYIKQSSQTVQMVLCLITFNIYPIPDRKTVENKTITKIKALKNNTTVMKIINIKTCIKILMIASNLNIHSKCHLNQPFHKDLKTIKNITSLAHRYQNLTNR